MEETGRRSLKSELESQENKCVDWSFPLSAKSLLSEGCWFVESAAKFPSIQQKAQGWWWPSLTGFFSFCFVVKGAEVNWCSCMWDRVIWKPHLKSLKKKTFKKPSETGAIHLKIAITAHLVHHVFMTVCLKSSIHLHCGLAGWGPLNIFKTGFGSWRERQAGELAFLVVCSAELKMNANFCVSCLALS